MGVRYTLRLCILSILWMLMAHSSFANTQTDTKEIHIPHGATGHHVTQILYQHKIIKYKTLFYTYLKIQQADTNLRAGTFLLSPDYSYKKISDILQEKKGAASLTKVTIPEGYSLLEIASTLEQKKVIQNANSFVTYVDTRGKQEFENEFKFLATLSTPKMEGYLFPETYVFAKGISNKAILRTFLDAFKKNALPIFQKYPQSDYSLHEILTLASIVEREARDKSEMTLISGVFHNRLKRGIPLAACPTVGYALGNPRKKMMTYKDIKHPSPYNTYRHKGLPPTPIASPGAEAIAASLDPKKTKALYFVANGDGTHTFSRTLKEHLRAQQRILKKQNQKN